MCWTGPHRLDLGDIPYAPNTLQAPDGRTLMLAWLQELRRAGGFDYAGCLSVPRRLSLQGERLEILCLCDGHAIDAMVVNVIVPV